MASSDEPSDNDIQRLSQMITLLHSNLVGTQAWLMAIAEEMAMLRAEIKGTSREAAMDNIQQRVETHIDELADLREDDLRRL